MKRIGRALGVVIAILGIYFVARELMRNRAEVLLATRAANLWILLAALITGIASMTIIGLSWRQCLAVLDVHRSRLDALRSYFVGQLGKYVPGGIWPVVGRAEMARRDGIAAGVAYGSTVLSLALTYLAGMLTSLSALLAGASAEGRVAWWALVLGILPLGVLALHPFFVEHALSVARRLAKRELDVTVPAWSTSILLLLRHVPAWIGIGGATWFVAYALESDVPAFPNILFATTLAWVVGFLAVGVPGGIGVREAVFVAAATTLSSTGVAAAVSLVARTLFILVDVTSAAITSVLSGHRRRREQDAPG